MSSSFLYLRLKITDKDGNNLDAKGNVSIINYPIASVFEKSEFYVNNSLVNTINNYGFQGYLTAHLSNTENLKTTTLKNGLYESETKGEIDASNTGFVERATYAKESSSIELTGKIYDPLWLQHRFMLPNVPLKLRLFRNKPEFIILHKGTDSLKIVYEEAILYVKRHFLSQQIQSMHMDRLNQGEKALYPVNINEIMTFPMPKMTTSHVRQWLFPNNKLPTRLVIAMIKTSAFEGKAGLNAFNFMHFNISKMSVSLNDDPGSEDTREFDFTDKRFLSAFRQTQAALKMDTNSINREAYADNHFINVFNILPSESKVNGNLKIELTFKKPLDEAVTVLLLGERKATISIDKMFNVATK